MWPCAAGPNGTEPFRGVETTVSFVANPFGGTLPERLLRQSTGCLACEAVRVRKRPQYQTPGRSSDPSRRGATGFDTQTKPEKTKQFGVPSGAPSFVQTGDRRGSTSSAQQLEFPSGSDGRWTEWDFRGLARGRFEWAFHLSPRLDGPGLSGNRRTTQETRGSREQEKETDSKRETASRDVRLLERGTL